MHCLSSTSIFFFLRVVQQLLTSFSSSSHPLYLSFGNVLYKAVLTQDVINPISFLPFLFSPQRVSLLLPLYNTSSLFTRPTQLDIIVRLKLRKFPCPVFFPKVYLADSESVVPLRKTRNRLMHSVNIGTNIFWCVTLCNVSIK